MDQLASTQNINDEVVFNCLNGKVSLRENIDCVYKEISIVVSSSGIPTTTTIFPLTDKTRNLLGIEVVKATNLTNSAVYPTGAPFITWVQVQTGIQIQHVTGLPAGNTFSLRLIGYY